MHELRGEGKLQSLPPVSVRGRRIQSLSQSSCRWTNSFCCLQGLEIDVAEIRAQASGIQPPVILVSGLIRLIYGRVQILPEPIVVRHMIAWCRLQYRFDILVDEVIHDPAFVIMLPIACLTKKSHPWSACFVG